LNDQPSRQPDETRHGDVPVARAVPIPRSRAVAPHPILLQGESRWRSLSDVTIVSVVTFALWYVLQSQVVDRIDVATSGDPRLINLFATLTVSLLVVSITMLVARRGNADWVRSLGLCGRPWWVTLGFGIIAMAGAYAVTMLTQVVVYTLIPSALPMLAKNQRQIVETLPKLHPAWFVLLALAVGFYEETFFRGFLLTRLRRVTGSSWIAVVATSVLFGAVHLRTQQPIAVVMLSFTGALWATLTLWRRSVVPAIIGHALFDLFNLIGLYYVIPGQQ
jgi:membrane protease YdiL (CAAX protease family)